MSEDVSHEPEDFSTPQKILPLMLFTALPMYVLLLYLLQEFSGDDFSRFTPSEIRIPSLSQALMLAIIFTVVIICVVHLVLFPWVTRVTELTPSSSNYPKYFLVLACLEFIAVLGLLVGIISLIYESIVNWVFVLPFLGVAALDMAYMYFLKFPRHFRFGSTRP